MKTQPPIQWLPRFLYDDKARSWYDADHSSPSSAKAKNEWELHILSPWRLHDVAGQLYFNTELALSVRMFHILDHSIDFW
jgi:hypothetical protein